MQTITLDDKNPQINYTTGWYSADGHVNDYNQTVTVTGNSNSGFHFTFNGTSIAVYGSVPPNNTAFSTYTIDTASLVTFTNPNITQYTSRQLFYQSPDLDDGEHTLAVNAPDTVIGDGASQFYFDFLTYVPSAPSSNVTTQASSAGPSSKSPDLKTILPAVLVPCIFIIIVLGLGLYMQRRRMRILRAKSEINENISYKQLESASVLPSAPTPSLHAETAGAPSAAFIALRSPRPDSSYSSYMPAIRSPDTRSIDTSAVRVHAPPVSLLRASSPLADPMLEATRARRLQHFDVESRTGEEGSSIEESISSVRRLGSD